MDSFFLTALVGGGLLLCGYFLGYARGLKQGTKDTTLEIFRTGLITPEELLAHYSKQGHENARNILDEHNKEKNDD